MTYWGSRTWFPFFCLIAVLSLVGCGRTAQEQAIDEQLEIIEHGTFEEYEEAVKVLAEMGLPAVDALIDGLKDSDEAVKCASADALGRIGDSRAVPALIKKLKDDDHFRVLEGFSPVHEVCVCENAARSLGKIGDWRAIEPLIQMLEESMNPGFRQAAAGGLGDLGAEEAIEPLIQALKQERYGTNYAADAALTKITGHIAYEQYEPWARWWEENKHRYGE
jgi:HEAT repeat protein